MRDPRPLIGEPLALDLLNTEWVEDDERRDLLTGLDGLRAWLRSNGLADTRATDGALARVREARDAIRAVVDHRDDAAARDALNAVLVHGRLVERLGPGGPEQLVEVPDEDRRAAWLAARNLLELLRTHPDRIRGCANHRCVLHFYDTSRAGRRQWCSMAACGNRAKARRHYARSREA